MFETIGSLFSRITAKDLKDIGIAAAGVAATSVAIDKTLKSSKSVGKEVKNADDDTLLGLTILVGAGYGVYKFMKKDDSKSGINSLIPSSSAFAIPNVNIRGYNRGFNKPRIRYYSKDNNKYNYSANYLRFNKKYI